MHRPGFAEMTAPGWSAGAWTMGDPGAWANPGGGGALYRGGGFGSHLGHLGPPVLSRRERLLAAHSEALAGMGPKGYRRSDERIFEEVCDALTVDGAVDARGIEVSVKSGVVTLAGVVPDRRQKRRAEEICDECVGVADVNNALRVADRQPAS